MFANLKAHGLIAQVRFHAKPLIFQDFDRFTHIIVLLPGDIHHDGLYGRKPRWERACMLFNENP